MGAKSQAKHIRRLGTHAKRNLKISPDVVKARNVEMAAHKAQPLKQFRTQAQQVAARPPVRTGVSRKTTPTQAHSPMQLSRHLAKANPKQAIQASQQYKTPLVGSAGVMQQLERHAKIGLASVRVFLRKHAGAERVLFKGKSLLGIKSPAKATAAKLTTPKIPSPKTQKFGITTSK